MKTFIKLFCVILISFYSLLADSSADEIDLVRYCSKANILKQGEFQYSLFKSSEYGLSDKFTITAHPIGIFLSPSVDLKYRIFNNEKMALSLFHGFNIPSLMMNTVKTKGTGGLISPEFDIPFMLSLRNGISADYRLAQNHIISMDVSIDFALFNGSLEPGTSIDLPIIMPRSAVYYKNIGINTNLSGEGALNQYFDYSLNTEIWIFPFESDNFDKEYDRVSCTFFCEITPIVFWKISETFKLGVGAKYCYGVYAFGRAHHLLPMIDFVKLIR